MAERALLAGPPQDALGGGDGGGVLVVLLSRRATSAAFACARSCAATASHCTAVVRPSPPSMSMAASAAACGISYVPPVLDRAEAAAHEADRNRAAQAIVDPLVVEWRIVGSPGVEARRALCSRDYAYIVVGCSSGVLGRRRARALAAKLSRWAPAAVVTPDGPTARPGS